MSENWKINKWMDDMTPRRAIQNFFDHATPVDSPDPEELVQLAPIASSDPQDATPVAGSSQASQRPGVLKRKLVDQDQLTEGNTTKKSHIEETSFFQDDSVFGLSEFPSQLASPSVVIPPRPNLRSKTKRVSMTAFTQVIQSQQSQASAGNEASMDEPSIPSELGSPDEAVSKRPGKVKSRVSVSAFAETLKKHPIQESMLSKSSNSGDESNLGITGIPSNLESPDYIVSQRPGPSNRRNKRVSSTGFKQILEQPDAQEEDSPSPSPLVPYALDSPDQVTSQQSVKSKKRVSNTAFAKILENPIVEEPVPSPITEELQNSSNKAMETSHLKRGSLSALQQALEGKKTPELAKSPVLQRTRSSARLSSRNELRTPEVSKSSDASVDRESLLPSNVPDMEVSGPRRSLRGRLSRAESIPEIQDPPATQVVNETNLKDPSFVLQPILQQDDDDNLEQYLSLSDLEEDGAAAGDIVEFTVQPLDLEKSSIAEVDELVERIAATIPTTPEQPIIIAPPSTPMVVIPQSEHLLNSDVELGLQFSRTFATAEVAPDVFVAQDLESPDDFEPMASSTQLIKRKPIDLDETPMEEEEIPKSNTRSRSQQSKSKEVSVSTSNVSDIPSRLDSPEQAVEERRRPGPSSAKKRVSMTQFLAALSQKTMANEADEDRLPSKTPSPMPTAEEMAAPSRSRTPSPSTSTSSVTLPRTESDDEIDDLDALPSADLVAAATTTPVDAIKSTVEPSASENRSRKSLKFDSPSAKEISKLIQSLTDEVPNEEQDVEETPSTDSEDPVEENAPGSERTTVSTRSSVSSRSSRQSEKLPMSPSNLYPALKNSTVVAGGAPFLGTPLSMSPIRSVEKDTPPTVQSTPSTPVQAAKKPPRAVSQSPMFMNVMQKVINKTAQEKKQSIAPIIETINRQSIAPIVETSNRQTIAPIFEIMNVSNNPSTPRNISVAKGSSVSNPSKGKSLLLAPVDERPDSETEWEDFEDDPKVKPLAIKIAFEDIEDRSKDYVPLEQRLKANPLFQAKVKSQRAKLAAQKAAEEANAAAKKKKAERKPRAGAATAKKIDDNIANLPTNKANLRFYARTKVTKEALDSVHDLVGEWFNFTLDQMETFCHDEGKPALESWEDCLKLLKRQGIVKNYWEYSGLCHELLMNDECAKLLPSGFPPGHNESKREVKKQQK